jgi:inhibitor of KinA
MRMAPLGDSAWILSELEAAPHAVAAALESHAVPGLIEAVASYETVGLYVDPSVFEPEAIPSEAAPEEARPRSHAVPVCYEMGEDLAAAADALGLAAERLIELHTAQVYVCFAIGFCPGFPYLGYLDERISGLPRLGSPRSKVPAGSVAITGRQTGVYPLQRPGGWNIIGRTPLCLVDVEARYFPISAGDKVRFERISAGDYDRRLGERL